jgi:DNA polymerase
MTKTSAAEFVPPQRTLTALRRAAAECEGCDLYKQATQTVFGEGSTKARLMLVGETPGDQEDREGRPFVGPAGKLLDRVLDELSIARREVYVTNAVKHFRWTPSGTRRLHAKPSSRQQSACRPWLDAELDAVHPAVIVCLGATAAQALLGKTFRVTKARGEIVHDEHEHLVIATHHPSAVLRAPSSDDRQRMQDELREDLAKAWQLAQSA